VAVPFWLYAAVSRNLSMRMWADAGVLTAVAPLLTRVLQHVTLLLCALPFYRWHVRLGLNPAQRWRQLFLLLAGGYLLAVLARPLLLFFLSLPDGWSRVSGILGSTLSENPWTTLLYWWPAAHIDFALSYVFSVTLMAGVQLFRDLRAESARRERAEAAWRDARLQVLRAQFDPHFIFNTLNTIANLSEQSPREVRNIVVRLSDLLRQSLLDRQHEFVTVAHELEAVAAYMDIQRARFRERLAFTVNVAPAALSYQLPSFILQPLLENAVRHGLAGDTDAVDVELTIDVIGATPQAELRIVISNSIGIGASQGAVQFGLGLSLTRDRLQTLMSDAACVIATTQPNGRFQVQLRFPTQNGKPQ
jgi:hypothetical protein